MADLIRTIKQTVRDLRPYSLAANHAVVKLNQNENPWGVPEAIRTETFRRLEKCSWSRYPGFLPTQLHRRLAAFTGWDPEGITAGNGSNELIQALMMVAIERGKRVLISEPTFALYRQIATILGGEVISVPLTDQLTYNVNLLRTQMESSSPDLTILCSPNNPTGCLVTESELASLLEVSRGLIVIDEAYHEFSEQSLKSLLSRNPNLVILRTFSKAMAMAGLRVGYLLAAPELVSEIRKGLLPYNLNVISQTAAEVALDLYDEQVKPLVKRLIEERERLYDQLRSIPGLKPVPSRANFILVSSTIPPRRVFTELLDRGILIRDVSSYPMLSNHFRVSVGRPEENDALLFALNEICKREAVNQ